MHVTGVHKVCIYSQTKLLCLYNGLPVSFNALGCSKGVQNGQSKFYHLGLFTFKPSQLTLRRRLGGFWRSLKRHVTDVKTIAGMSRIDRNSANTKIYAYEIKQNVSKNFFFLLRTPPRSTALHTVFFSCYHWQRLLFYIRKIISQRP